MRYNLIPTSNLKEEYLRRHNLDLNKYNEDYDFNIDEEAINDFYNKLIENLDKKFLIVGDYDCDGICSVSIIKNLLKELSIENSYYIPSRIKEGYGLNKLIVDNAIKYRYDVILLVDNGVSCSEAIDYAYQHNIKVLIIDHHKFSDKPRCEAFLHQDLLSKEFEFASAGELCFLLSLKHYFDEYNLVLGGLTILSDYIVINAFNRFIVSEMLTYLNQFDYLPFNLLNEGSNYTGDSIKFNIIPKINSISRMETEKFNSNHAVKFLLSMFPNISDVNDYISSLNKTRKEESNKIFNEVISKKYEGNYVYISDNNIKEGYCSSLATKLSNYFDKPVFVFSESDGVCKGSGRCQSYDIYYLLSSYDKYVSFGGHEHAVGISILKENVDDFKKFLNNVILDMGQESVEDVYVVDVKDINESLVNDINSLGPFGNGYEMPIIGIKNNNYQSALLKNKYTKYLINNSLSAITFDEKYIGFVPDLIIGSLNKDSYHKGAFSIVIKALI